MREQSAVILGAGPAGLTAGIYCLRARIRAVCVEKMFPGGNLLVTERIDNYPGFPEGISGMELAERMKQQFVRLGGELVSGDASGIGVDGEPKTAVLASGQTLAGGVLIIATGGIRRKLGVEGEERLAGKGVSYCAVCDAAFFRDKVVAVVGGGNSALEEALYLARSASRCYLLHRRDEFRGGRALQEEVSSEAKIVPLLSTVVERIAGESKVEKIVVRNVKTGVLSDLPVDGVFVSVGQKPNTAFAAGKLAMNPSGYLETDERMETSVPGVFACGDARRKELYQVVTACGDGAVAAFFAEKHLAAGR